MKPVLFGDGIEPQNTSQYYSRLLCAVEEEWYSRGSELLYFGITPHHHFYERRVPGKLVLSKDGSMEILRKGGIW